MGSADTRPNLDPRPSNGRQRTVDRQRLFAALDRVLHGGLGLVSASAGAGKTTLLRSWVDQLEGVRVGWLTVRDEHEDPRRLAKAIAASLGEIGPDVGSRADIIDRLERLALTDGPVLVVLDDAHLLEEPSAIDLVVRLARERSVPLSVVVSGRYEGSLPWHRLELRSSVELRDVHLSFEPDEAADLLARGFGVVLPEAELDDLFHTTRGWAAGLCLAGLEFRDMPDRAALQRSHLGRHASVRSFMESEVLAGLSGDQIRFLEITSVLDRLHPELCDVLTGRSDSVDVLDAFVEMNLFTEQVSDSPPEFEYHALFGECLRSRLERSSDVDRSVLFAKASEWYESHGLVDAAIASAFESGQLERAERLVRAACGREISSGHMATVVRWLRRLPAHRIVQNPDLALVLGRASFSRGDLLMARTTAAWVAEQSPEDPSWSPGLELALTQLQLLVDMAEGSMSRAVQRADEALALYAELDDPTGVSFFGIDQEPLLIYRALAVMLAGDFHQAVEVADAALTPARLAHPSKATVQGVGVRALALAWSGDVSAASVALGEGLDIVGSFDGSTSDHLFFHLAGVWLGGDDAEEHLNVARWIAADTPLPMILTLLRLTEARFAFGRRSFDVASAALGRVRQDTSAMPDPGVVAELAEALQVEVESASRSSTGQPLNEREAEILAVIATGASRREAADSLYLSLNTVKTYLRTAYRKLGAADRTEAIDRARSMGLIGPGPDA